MHITAQVGKASADGFTRSNPLGDAKKQTEFNENDEISVQADGQDAVTYQFNGSEWLPKESNKFLKWEKETMNFTAYYPATFNGTINQPEKYDSEDDLAAADFMSFSGPQTNSKDNNNQLTLIMERKMARVVVEIADFNDQYAGATIDNVNSLSICGIKAYKHSDNKFYALIKPIETAQSTSEFLSLEVGDNKVKETLTGIPALEAGKSYTYQLTVGKNKISVSGITVADWENTGIITEGSKAEQIIPYVTFKANEDQKFKMEAYGYTISGLEYSVKDGEWTPVVANTEVSFGGDNGDLRLRGKNPDGTSNGYVFYSTITFTKDAPVACTGDIRTLLDWNNYNKVETHYANFCYLFKNCSVLTSAPELPAEILADFCYMGMFRDCTNLTSAPELPAEKLAHECYNQMFYGCTKLSTVTMLALDPEFTSKLDCVYDWLYDAGTDPSVTTRTLKIQDAAAYNALVNTGHLPENWKIDYEGTTVVNKNNGKIE